MNNSLQRIISSNKLICLTLFICTFIVYAWVLPAGFKTVDDYFCIIGNQQLRDVKNLPTIFTTSFFGEGSYYRPLVYVSFMIEYQLFGLNSFFFNLTNVLLHFGSAFAVFLIINALSKDRVLSFWTALLFAIHPISWEAVTNIPGRSILLCAIFFLYSIYFFIRFVSSADGKIKDYALSLFLFMCSLLSKESGIVLPLVLMSFIFINVLVVERKKIFRYALLYWVIVIMYLLWRRYLGIVAGTSWESTGMMVVGIITFLKAGLHYVVALLLPMNFHFDRAEPFVTDPKIAIGVLSFWVVVFALFIVRARDNKLVNFLVCWIILNMLIVCQVIPIRVSYGEISTADHFLYLAGAGYFALFVLVARKVFQQLIAQKQLKQASVNILIGGYLIFLGLTTMVQTIYAREQIAMFEETLRHSPDNTRVRLSLATAYGFIKRSDLAEESYRRILEKEPFEMRARIGLGVAFADQGKCAAALKEYDKIIDAGGLQSLLESNRQGAVDCLIKQYEYKLEKEGDVPGLHYSLGVMYERSAKDEEALAHYQKELALNPNHSHTLFNLASYFGRKNEKAEAISHYEQMIKTVDSTDSLYKMAMDRLEQLKK